MCAYVQLLQTSERSWNRFTRINKPDWYQRLSMCADHSRVVQGCRHGQRTTLYIAGSVTYLWTVCGRGPEMKRSAYFYNEYTNGIRKGPSQHVAAIRYWDKKDPVLMTA